MRETELSWLSKALPEWQEHRVTQALQQAMQAQMEIRKEALCKSYLAGRPVPEADRLALLMVEQWVEDFFESTAEDVQAMMETINEHIGFHSDGIQRPG